MARETKKSGDEGIAVEELAALQARVAARQLDPDDWARLGKLIHSFLTLVQMLEHPKLKLRQIRRKLFGDRTEPPAPPPGTPAEMALLPTSAATPPAAAETEATPTEKAAAEKAAAEKAAEAEAPAQQRKGHGRRAAREVHGAEFVTCVHRELLAGGGCPLPGCAGKLYDTARPQEFIRWVGHPPLTATRYAQQVLRCAHCQHRFAAELLAGVTPQKYDETADVALVLNKFGQMTPWTRLAGMQEGCKLPLAEATQWERCECVADALLPVFRELEKQAAQAELVGADDTRVKILSHLQAQKLLPAKERRTTHTTGVVAETKLHKIVLLSSGAQHAGEVIGKLWALREGSSAKPIQIGDALASNWSHEYDVIAAKCWAHAVRRFKELAGSFPAAVNFVRGSIAACYQTDRKAHQLKLTPGERLCLHQVESVPVLLRLAHWRQQQFDERLVEPNSALGKEIQYLENHWHELTEFTRTAGIPLDNNRVERALRRPALLRKNALFFKTEHGANVGSLLLSVLATCRANAVNAWEYFLSAYRNARAVREKPFDWTPWRWAELQGQPSG